MQKIDHICNVNALTAFSSWTDIEGQKNRYWDGHHNSSREGCKCFTEETCDSGFSAARNINYKCHCDSYLPDAQDHGIFRSTSKLPVMKLNYGGSITPYSSINFKLDPLVCSGKKTFYPSEFALAERVSIKKEISSFHAKLKQVKIDTDELLNSTLNQIISNNAVFQRKMDALINERLTVITSAIGKLNSTVAFRATGHDNGGSLCKNMYSFNIFIFLLSNME